MSNILSFKVSGLTFVDGPISEQDSNTPRQVILSLKGLASETKDNKVFILVEKDYNGNYILYYKKKYHRDASTMAEELGVVMVK